MTGTRARNSCLYACYAGALLAWAQGCSRAPCASPPPASAPGAGASGMQTARAQPSAAEPSAPVSATGKWVTGYYAAYQRDLYPPEEIDWSGISHLVFTRLKTPGAGQLQRDFDVDAVNGPVLARQLAQQAHAHGRKALLMLGGAGMGHNIHDSALPRYRAGFAAALVQAVRELGYDGLDLDWEEALDYDLLIALCAELRSLAGPSERFTITVPGFAINPNLSSVNPRIKELIPYIDQYNLMTYYPATALAGSGWLSWHNSPLLGAKPATPVSIEDSLARYTALGIPAGKLGMGVAFYAICYTDPVSAPGQSTEGGVRILGGDNELPLSALFARGGAYDPALRHWDAAVQAPYLSLPAADARGCRYYAFDDEESLVAKGRFARERGYGGIIVWTLNQGWLRGSAKPANALMQALRRGFLE